MPVGIRIKFAGVTQGQFDAVNEHVDPAGDPPVGLISLASGPIDGGWGVIDFWNHGQRSMPAHDGSSNPFKLLMSSFRRPRKEFLPRDVPTS